MSERRAGDAGFTPIEMIVALAVFAIVALAGLALADTVLDARTRSAGRLDRLGDLGRALALMTRDLTELTDAPLAGGPATIGFTRRTPIGPVGVGYRIEGDRLVRVAAGRRQVVLEQVAGIQWHYYASGGWRNRWPAGTAPAPGWPAAVAIDINLTGPRPRGRLRRVVALPVRPLPPGAVATR